MEKNCVQIFFIGADYFMHQFRFKIEVVIFKWLYFHQEVADVRDSEIHCPVWICCLLQANKLIWFYRVGWHWDVILDGEVNEDDRDASTVSTNTLITYVLLFCRALAIWNEIENKILTTASVIIKLLSLKATLNTQRSVYIWTDRPSL